MASLAGFNANEVGERDDFAVVPAGTYPAIAVSSEMKPTKSGTGQMLVVTFELLDGQFKGSKVWARMNLVNQNQQAVDIAKRELGELCRAVGVIMPNDSSELHNRPLMLELDVEKDDKNKDRNVIKKYHSINQGGAVGTQAPAANAPVFGQPTGGGAASGPAASPPWAKK